MECRSRACRGIAGKLCESSTIWTTWIAFFSKQVLETFYFLTISTENSSSTYFYSVIVKPSAVSSIEINKVWPLTSEATWILVQFVLIFC